MADKPDKAQPRLNVRQRRVATGVRGWYDAARERQKAEGREQLTQRELARLFQWSEGKLSNILNGRVAISPTDVIAMAAILGVEEAKRDSLLKYAYAGLEGSVWWRAYGGDIHGDFAEFMETESEAWKAWNVETMIVPGLLQTSAYTDAVVNSAWPRPSQETVEQRRKLRQRRQARLRDETNRLELHAIMHESALIQEIGDDESVMAEQLDHIVEMSELSNIVVQLIPISRGAYASFGRSYNLLGFDRDDPDAIAVYEETLSTGIYIEADTDTSKYTLHFQRLSTHEALDPQASIQRIATLRARLAS